MESALVGGGLMRPTATRCLNPPSNSPRSRLSCSAPWATGRSTTRWTAPAPWNKPSSACARTWACLPTSAPAICYDNWSAHPASSPELIAGWTSSSSVSGRATSTSGQPRGCLTAVDGHFPVRKKPSTMRYAPRNRAHRPRRLPGRPQAQQARHQRGQGAMLETFQFWKDVVTEVGQQYLMWKLQHVRGQRRHATGQGPPRRLTWR